MFTAPRLFVYFLRSTSGATAIEYALIASLIFLVILTAVIALGSNVRTMYQSIAAAF